MSSTTLSERARLRRGGNLLSAVRLIIGRLSNGSLNMSTLLLIVRLISLPLVVGSITWLLLFLSSVRLINSPFMAGLITEISLLS